MDFTNRIDIKNLAVRTGVPLLGCIVAAMATIYIMQEINPLAASCVCAAAVLVVIAVVSPRTGLIVLLFLCGYSDLFKRMLVFWSELSWDQLSYVLAVAPLVVVGLACSILTGWAFRAIEINRRDTVIGALVVVMVAANVLMAKRLGADAVGALKEGANAGLYMALMLVALKFATESADVLRLFRWAVLLFIPVAIYGIFQAFFGFADFEVLYLQSGFTGIVFEGTPRPFSTLNSAGAFGDVSAIMAILSLTPLLVRRETVLPLPTRLFSLGLFSLFTLSCVLSLVRHSMFVLLAALVGIVCFRSTRKTKLFYLLGGSALVALVLSSSFLLDHIAEWDPASHMTSEFGARAVGVQTYSERLKGFANLTRSLEMYSLFGLPESQKMTEGTFNHDPLSAMLVDYGVVVVLAVLTAMVLALKAAHGRLLAMPAGISRNLAVMLLSLVMSILASHLLFHGVLSTFPVNALFWLSAGLFLSLLVHQAQATEPPPSMDRLAEPGIPRWMPVDQGVRLAGGPAHGREGQARK